MTLANPRRELVLDQKTAALDVAIAQLQQLPFTLDKQTNQYIGMGVREAIRQVKVSARWNIDVRLNPPKGSMCQSLRLGQIRLYMSSDSRSVARALRFYPDLSVTTDTSSECRCRNNQRFS